LRPYIGGMPASPALVWFRQDLRLADNPALHAAAGRPVLPVFLLDEVAAGAWAPGGATRWWLHHSLAALAQALASVGAPLLLARGRAEILIPALAEATGAAEVLAGRRPEPWARAQEAAVAEALTASGRRLRLFSNALHDPMRIASGSGRPYAVFTPFAKAVLAGVSIATPLPAPARLHGLPHPWPSEALEDWHLLPQAPTPDWAAGFHDLWQPGEAGAAARLARFLAGALAGYATGRDLPAEEGSSGLSPHLAFGEISPRQAWHAAMAAGGEQAQPFLRQLLWREFSQHLLWHRPEMPERPLRPAYAAFPWQPDNALLRAWQRGRTGIPFIDAGMRQLWRTGWMHNRVRMVAASFLVKHLLQPWHDGARWFWDVLVDADLANNSASWQWVAGCGIDATPWFRIFNPVAQGEKFDPAGRYVRRFVPELARLPVRFIHRPWEAPAAVLDEAGVRLGETYPSPLVEHAAARRRALDALASLKAGAEAPGDELEDASA
jgi:deoxyribodipyrimidine photo-lyase